jgi:hypothetical protein
MERTFFVSYTTASGKHVALYVKANGLVAFLKRLSAYGATVNNISLV